MKAMFIWIVGMAALLGMAVGTARAGGHHGHVSFGFSRPAPAVRHYYVSAPAVYRYQVYRPGYYYTPYQPLYTPVVVPGPVVMAPAPIYVAPVEPYTIDPRTGLPVGFVESSRRVHGSGSDKGELDWIKGHLPGGRRLKIEFEGNRVHKIKDD